MCGSVDFDLIGFEAIEATTILLTKIGIESDLGRFIYEHLRDVLRKQYAELDLHMVRMLSVGDCTFDGQPTQGTGFTEITSLTIPFNLEAFVTLQRKLYCIELELVVRATADNQNYKLETDVIILQQSLM